jgi:prepilin-type N-terminal cleavage/methylation domain-containing protein
MFRFIKQLHDHQKSFTLIELLIVIAILALLMSIIIITLNPSELLKQTRDTKRISNLKSINNALSIFQATKPTTSMGTASIVYISIPDSSSTCTNLSLPTLPTGYTYQCSTTANYKKTDGTGWIPVNFDSLDIGSPLSSLPIDPTNTTSTNLFYTYTTGASWELNAILESSANKLSGDNDKTSLDGGDSYSTYEIGTDLSLSPYKDTGLVAYWKMDEGTGSTTKDTAATNNGTITGATWKSSSDGCPSGNCLYFDGDDYVATPSFALSGTVLTVTGWVKMINYDATYQSVAGSGSRNTTQGFINIRKIGLTKLWWEYANGSSIGIAEMPTFFTDYNNTWVNFTIVADYSGLYPIKFYRNGELILVGSMIGTPVFPSINEIKYLGMSGAGIDKIINGHLDDFRIYNRELSASEIKAIYEGTK